MCVRSELHSYGTGPLFAISIFREVNSVNSHGFSLLLDRWKLFKQTSTNHVLGYQGGPNPNSLRYTPHCVSS